MDILDACQAVLDCSRSIPDHKFDKATWKALLQAKNDAESVHDMLTAKCTARQIMPPLTDLHMLTGLARGSRLMWEISTEIDFTLARLRFYEDLNANLLDPGFAVYNAQGRVLQCFLRVDAENVARDKQFNAVIWYVNYKKSATLHLKQCHAVYRTLF